MTLYIDIFIFFYNYIYVYISNISGTNTVNYYLKLFSNKTLRELQYHPLFEFPKNFIQNFKAYFSLESLSIKFRIFILFVIIIIFK